MESVWRLRLLFISALIGLSGRHAHGQIINQFFPQGVPGYETGLGVTVGSRARDEYVAPGVRLDEFVVKPALNESIGYNSNVNGLPKAKGSLEINTALTLQASTDWTRNGFFTYLSVDDLRFPELPSLNQTSWVAALGGTHEFGRDQLQVGYSHFNLQQTAADIGSLNFQTPATFQVDDIRSSYKADFGRITVSPGIQVTHYSFEQASLAGLQNFQQYRDRTTVVGSVSLSYSFANQRNALLVFRGVDTQYARSQPGAPSQDNSGVSILAGLEYTANGVFRYRGLLGLEERSSVSSVYATQVTPVGEGEVIWTPTGVTTVTGSVSRAIEDAASGTASGYIYTAARISVDHEFRKNILLNGYAGLQSADFQQGGGSQTITNAGLGATWLLSRNVRVGATYDFTSSSVTTSPTNFVGNAYQRHLYLIQVSLAL